MKTSEEYIMLHDLTGSAFILIKSAIVRVYRADPGTGEECTHVLTVGISASNAVTTTFYAKESVEEIFDVLA